MLPSSNLPHLKHRSGRQCQIAVKNITLDFSDKGLHAQYQHPIVQKKSVKSSTGTEFDAKIVQFAKSCNLCQISIKGSCTNYVIADEGLSK